MFLSIVKHNKFIIQLLEQNLTSPMIVNSIYAPKVAVLVLVKHLEVKIEMKILW